METAGSESSTPVLEATARPDGAPGPPAARRLLIGAIEVAVAAVAVAFLLRPVSVHPLHQLAGTYDAPYFAWLGWRVSQLWSHGSFLPGTIPDAVFPLGYDLRLADGLLPAGVMAALNLLTGNVMLAYNLALAIGVGLDVWAARRLARVLSTRRWVWMATGIAFAAAPALAGALGAHITFVYGFTLPLLLRRAILVARDGRVAWGWLAALFVAAYLCSAYHLVFGGITFVVVVVAWPGSAIRRREVWSKVLAAMAVAAIVLSPFALARLSYDRDEQAAGAPDVVRTTESVAFSADAFELVTPPDSTWIHLPVPHVDLPPELYAPLRPAFLGYALGAGLIGMCFVRGAARRPLLISAGVLWVLSLGPTLHVAGHVVGGDSATSPGWMPYRWLQSLPGLGALRAPTRASYALAAVAAAALAISLDAWCDRMEARAALATAARPDARSGPEPAEPSAGALGAAGAVREVGARPWWPSVVGATVVGLLVILSAPGPLPTSDLALTPTTRQALETMATRSAGAGDHADAVLVVPWGCRPDDPRITALQTIHQRPMIGCTPPPTATRWYSGLDPWVSSSALAALRCDPTHIDSRPTDPATDANGEVSLGGDDGIAALRTQLSVRYVIVEAGAVPPTGCASVRDALATLDRYEVLGDDGTWRIIDLDHETN
jgi:hypothetical protein